MADEADEPQGDERIRDPTAATESLNPLWDSSIVVTNPAAATVVRLKGRGWRMLSEAKTRAERIDLQLAKAGWTRDSRCLVEEMPLPGGSRPIRDPSAPYGSADAFADYALLDRLNRPLAVVEAKRTSRSPVEGERQAADSDEIERLREPIVEHLGLLPAELPEIRAHLEQLAWAQSAGFWDHLDYPRIMELQDTFAPLMRFGQRRPAGEMIRLTLPDPIAHRHWIVFGPAGEGAFVESYREQVEAFIRDLAEDSPALQRLRAGHELTDGELDSVAQLLNRPDLFVTEQRLRLAFGQPDASLAELLRHILTEAKLPNRERQISAAFEKWVAGHAQLNATP